jgi:hypothetical protein
MSDKVAGDSRMTLAMLVNCHHNVQMIALKAIRAFGARLQPQLKHLVDWLVHVRKFLQKFHKLTAFCLLNDFPRQL